MTYRLFAFIEETDTQDIVKEVSLLYLDGMLVADRALEDVFFTIALNQDRTDLEIGILNPEDMPDMINVEAVKKKAREMALGSPTLDAPSGGEGMIWNEDLPAEKQICPFETYPQIL